LAFKGVFQVHFGFLVGTRSCTHFSRRRLEASTPGPLGGGAGRSSFCPDGRRTCRGTVSGVSSSGFHIRMERRVAGDEMQAVQEQIMEQAESLYQDWPQ